MFRKLFVLMSLIIILSMLIPTAIGFSRTNIKEKGEYRAKLSNYIHSSSPDLGEETNIRESNNQQNRDINTQSTSLPYDVFVHAKFGDADTLDPAYNYESFGNSVIVNIYDQLITPNRENVNEFLPTLATNWDISDDGMTYTFHIRKGVKFHNGNDLTPEDVAYTFQRAVMQGGGSSPQWLFTEAYFGTGIYDITCLVDNNQCQFEDDPSGLQGVDPTILRNICNRVTNTIVADNAAGTVSFHLAQPWSPFLATLIGSWGSIIDKEWSIAQGAWDGNCSTWQNYYGVNSDTTPLRNITNGTGPFKLDHWTPGDEIVLTRNQDYWRQSPIWQGGPSGPASFAEVRIILEDDATVRKNMLLNGEADMVDTSREDVDELKSNVLFSYDTPDGLSHVLENPAGTLNFYHGGYATSATDAFFTYDIQTGGTINYIGSGMLDGNGIPPDFFTDIHVRKAFNYAFDWTEYITDVLGGNAIQRTGPIIKGLNGYADDQPKYTYNSTLAKQEFDQAWGGQVASNGFELTLAYNNGNFTRQKIAEIIKAGVEAIDPKYHINIIGLDWTDFIKDQYYGRIPIFITGWAQDIPHPHNWVQPYLVGVYGYRQHMPDDMRNKYQNKINDCLTKQGDEARICYEDIQTTTHQDALDIFLAQVIRGAFSRAEVRGYYLASDSNFPTYYVLSKGPLPTSEQVTPSSAQDITSTSNLGSEISAHFPEATVTQTISVTLTPNVPQYFGLEAPWTALTFDISAFNSDGNPIEQPTLNNSVVITIDYTQEDIGSLNESQLMLVYWNGSNWEDAACGEYIRDLENNSLQVPICHLSTFALGQQAEKLFLPLMNSKP